MFKVVKKVCLIGSAAVGACTILTIGGVGLWSVVTKGWISIKVTFYNKDLKSLGEGLMLFVSAKKELLWDKIIWDEKPRLNYRSMARRLS